MGGLHEEHPPLTATGSFEIALPGSPAESFDLTGCWAQTVHIEEWSTNPNAYVADWEGTEMSCALESEGYDAEVFGFTDESGGFIDVIVWGPGSEPGMDEALYRGAAEAVVEPGTVSSEFELWSPFGEDPVGMAIMFATLERGDGESFGATTSRSAASTVSPVASGWTSTRSTRAVPVAAGRG